MSSDQYLLERIPWYLNGTLDEVETAEVERLLAASPEGRAELAEARAVARIYGHRLPSEVLVAYALEGKHEDVPTELIERYLAVSPVASQELALVRESLALMDERGSAPEAPLPFRRRAAAAEPVQGWRRLALAASILGVVGLGLAGWQWIEVGARQNQLAQMEQQLREALVKEGAPAADATERQRLEALEAANLELAAGKSDLVDQLEQQNERIKALDERIAGLSEPLLNVPVLDVYPGDRVLRGQPPASQRVVVPRETRTVTLILNSGIQADQEVTELRILAADGARTWTSPGRPERDALGIFTVAIPVQSFDRGVYSLQLVEERDGQTQVVESYQIEIR